MKVLLINGSPHQRGCTYTALSEVAKTLQEQGIDTEIFQLGTQPVHGCIGCNKCRQIGKCVFDDDVANSLLERMKAADGVIIGSPVYFGGPNGALCTVLDRACYASAGKLFFKPAAAIVNARRAGTTAALDRLNKYIMYMRGVSVASQYWCMTHGHTPEDVRKDKEGLQIMRTLGRSMAWILKSIEQGKEPTPCIEPRIKTSFEDGL